MKKSLLLILLFGFIAPMNLLAQNSVGIECKSCPVDTSTAKKKYAIDTVSNYCIINGMAGGLVDSAAIANWTMMKVMKRVGHDTESVKVKSYNCIIQAKGGAKVYSYNSSLINDELKAAILQCNNKDLIIFYSIVTYNELGEEKSIMSGPVFRYFLE